jgi:hypothetical protein
MLVVGEDREDVADEQHRQHDSRRVARAKQEGEDDDVHEAGAGKTRLGDPKAGRGDGRKQPLCEGEVRQRP